jgi:hypothetical protein
MEDDACAKLKVPWQNAICSCFASIALILATHEWQIFLWLVDNDIVRQRKICHSWVAKIRAMEAKHEHMAFCQGTFNFAQASSSMRLD